MAGPKETSQPHPSLIHPINDVNFIYYPLEKIVVNKVSIVVWICNIEID